MKKMSAAFVVTASVKAMLIRLAMDGVFLT